MNRNIPDSTNDDESRGSESSARWSREALEQWLVERLATELKVKRNEIDREAHLATYNLDSLTAITLVGELEELLNRSLSPSLFYEHATIKELSRFLASGKAA
jgi:acyl carrier protein